MNVKELIDLLMEFPEEEKVYVPDWTSDKNFEVNNVVLTVEGALIDY